MKRKVLLMGKSGSGKTSMRSLIFSSYRAEDTKRLGSTIEVEHSHVRFLGNLVLNLWDCGGQQSYMDSYMETQRSQVFSYVGVLIYVFDLVATEDEAEDQREWEADLRYYGDCLAALQENSPDAQVFCLLHKMDLLEPARRKQVYTDRVRDLRKRSREVLDAGAEAARANPRLASPEQAASSVRVHCFATSIWDASLYRAWSCIIYTLIPKVHKLEEHLTRLAETCSAAEVVLFEKVTFLVLARSGPQTQLDDPYRTLPGNLVASEETEVEDAITRGFPSSMARESDDTDSYLAESRFEQISGLVKHFKMACANAQHQFQAFELRTRTFSAYLDLLTLSTYILVVVPDPHIQLSAVRRNVELSRRHFEDLQALSSA